MILKVTHNPGTPTQDTHTVRGEVSIINANSREGVVEFLVRLPDMTVSVQFRSDELDEGLKTWDDAKLDPLKKSTADLARKRRIFG